MVRVFLEKILPWQTKELFQIAFARTWKLGICDLQIAVFFRWEMPPNTACPCRRSILRFTDAVEEQG
jgi:hypothetical protein